MGNECVELKKEHTVLLLGALLILMAALPVAKLAYSVEILLFLDALLIVLFFGFFLSKLSLAFGKDRKRHFIFFSLWLVVIQFAFYAITFSNPLEAGMELFVMVLALLAMLALAARFVLGKKEVEGKVLLSDADSATVEIDFDLFAGLNSGKYFVSSGKKFKKGDLVRVSLKRKLFRKLPDLILGKTKG